MFTYLASVVLSALSASAVVPVIDSVTPVSANIGSEVTIHGSGFSSDIQDNLVCFGEIEAQILSASEEQLVVLVPHSVQYAPITLSTNGLISRSSDRFNITFNATEELQTEHLQEQLFSPYLGSSAKSIAMGDLNRDGVPDIVTTEPYWHVRIYEMAFDEDGLITIERSLSLDYGTGPWTQVHDVSLGDLNGDGRLDIVASEYGDITDDFDSHTCIFINTGSNESFAFDPPIILSGDGYEGYAQLEDMNGDGKLDIVTTRTNWHQMGVYLNTTQGSAVSFAPKVIVDAYVDPRPEYADFNGDGLIDVVSSGENRDVHIYFNESTENTLALQLALTVEAGGVEDPQYDYYWATQAPRLADIDGDGLLDIITRGGCFGCSPNGISVHRRTSNRAELSFAYEFEDYYLYASQSEPLRIEVADLNGDGNVDIVTTDWLGGLSIIMNDSTPGHISLQEQMIIGVGQFPHPLVMCDLNMDSTPELIVGNREVEGMRIVHNFLPVDSCVLAGDITGDGLVDVHDVLKVISGWGDPYSSDDILTVLAEWGMVCP
ncbi:MAG: FG-GAP-like repeat-containing protein [Phycisphaerales bacterium]|nr:FG-GAP-like repeat-containing protein [Phycisphaerales bacterium]